MQWGLPVPASFGNAAGPVWAAPAPPRDHSNREARPLASGGPKRSPLTFGRRVAHSWCRELTGHQNSAAGPGPGSGVENSAAFFPAGRQGEQRLPLCAQPGNGASGTRAWTDPPVPAMKQRPRPRHTGEYLCPVQKTRPLRLCRGEKRRENPHFPLGWTGRKSGHPHPCPRIGGRHRPSRQGFCALSLGRDNGLKGSA